MGSHALISSNTVMAVVPDSNRIPFYIYSVDNFSNRIFQYRIQFWIVYQISTAKSMGIRRDIRIQKRL